MRLIHHAEGVLCGVTFAMHASPAIEPRPGRPKHRPCVVIAGGREPAQWEAYPFHQYLSTVGMLSCCLDGGCWKSRCQLVGDGDPKDRNDLCAQPVQMTPELRIPKCLDMISAEDVIRRINLYYEGGLMSLEAPPAVVATETVNNGYVPQVPASIPRNGNPVAVLKDDRPKSGNIPAPVRMILLTFRHGLGDAIQFTAVLRHLRHYHPDWQIDVETLVGKHSAFRGLCRRIYVIDKDPPPDGEYHERHNLEWHECRSPNGRWPNTKVTRCLLEVFRLTPIADLCRYDISTSEAAQQRAAEYLESLCGPPSEDGRYRAVLIHYEGNTSGEQKNLSTELIRHVCDAIVRLDHVPIILDWDRRSPLPDNQRIFCPAVDHPLWNGVGTGDAEQLTALIAAARLMIGIDSGPLHVAGATGTDTLAVWTRHHPLNFFDLSPHVEHLVPEGHEAQIGDAAAIKYFQKAYRHRIYGDLTAELPALVECRLSGTQPEAYAGERMQNRLKSTAYSEAYYREHQRTGLDYLSFGDWQRKYGQWFVESMSLKQKRLLDVGCACGAVLRGLGEAGAIVQGVDLSEHMIQLGRRQWPDMTPLLHVCDAVNLHIFANGAWDAIHSAQVAEHWKPELVPFILRELRRVTTAGGILFCALDTTELFERQGRRLEDEDPTHICVRPMAWWHDQLAANGWELCGSHIEHRLRSHPDSFLAKYDWDWFAARAI